MSEEPIRYVNGEIRMVVRDLFSGGFGLPWGHLRSYTNQLAESHDFGNGYNWLVKTWPYLVEDGETAMAAVFDAMQAFWFDEGEGGADTARYGAKQTLAYNSGEDVFELTFPDGHVWEFYDPLDVDHPGLFKKVTTPGGLVTEVTSYSGGRITEVRRTSESDVESYVYSYSSGRLASVLLRRSSNGGTSWTELRKAEYTYHDGSDNYGSEGDLKTVTHSSKSGANWLTGDRYYYRYYKAGDNDGMAHGLKYVVEPQGYAEMVAANLTPAMPPTAPSTTTPATTSSTMARGESWRSRSSGAAGLISSPTPRAIRTRGAYNQWKTKTVETLPDGSSATIYTNFLGNVLLKEVTSDTDQWIDALEYDANGYLSRWAHRSAVASYTQGTKTLSVSLHGDRGLIEKYTYYGSTTATSSVAGGVEGYKQYDQIQEGSSGTLITLAEYKYLEHTDANGHVSYPTVSEKQYRSEAGGGSDPVETTYAYLWHDDNTSSQVLQRTITWPSVSSSQNGNDASASQVERFDAAGRLVWLADERGYLTHHEYDEATGVRTRTIQDVDHTQVARALRR